MMRPILRVLALAPLLFLAQGCNTYTYINLDLKLGTGFNTVTAGTIATCHVFVTGADSTDFNLDETKCQHADPATLALDKIQYSTFADSGSITFTLKLFRHGGERPECKLGDSGTTLAVESGKTLSGTITVPYTDPGTACP